MWKKDEVTPAGTRETSDPPARTETPRRAPAGSERATIGSSITIKGEVSGDEDLLIQGQVDGSVDLEEHSVTVGRDGRVKANITARVVTVEGEVEGDLDAQEQIILRNTATVKGDITAPRVVLEDGATFRGMVDMGEPKSSGRTDRSRSTGASSSASSSSAGTSGSGSSSSSGGSSSSGSSSSGSSSAGSSSGSSSSSSEKQRAEATDKASL